MRRIPLVAAIVVLTIVAGCDMPSREERFFGRERMRQLEAEWRARDSALEAGREFLRHELPRREAQWAAHRLTGYRLAVNVSCLCNDPPVTVVAVRGDSVTVTDALGLPHPVPLSTWKTAAVPGPAFSVPTLFAEIRHAVSDLSWTIEVTFDSTYGFPREIVKQKRLHDSMSEAHLRVLTRLGYRAVVESFEVLNRDAPALRLTGQN